MSADCVQETEDERGKEGKDCNHRAAAKCTTYHQQNRSSCTFCNKWGKRCDKHHTTRGPDKTRLEQGDTGASTPVNKKSKEFIDFCINLIAICDIACTVMCMTTLSLTMRGTSRRTLGIVSTLLAGGKVSYIAAGKDQHFTETCEMSNPTGNQTPRGGILRR